MCLSDLTFCTLHVKLSVTVHVVKISVILSGKACCGETKPKCTSGALLAQCVTPVLCFLPAVLSVHILQVSAVLPPRALRWKLEWCSRLRAAPLTFTPASPSCSQRDIPVMHRARGSNKRWCRWRLLMVGEAEVLSNVATVLSLRTASCGGHREAACLGLCTRDLCAALPSYSQPYWLLIFTKYKKI